MFGLQTLCQLKGIEFPNLGLPHFKYQFKGLARSLSYTTRRAHPLSPEILEKIFSILDFTDPLHSTMWSIMLLGFLLFSRIGNLLPKSLKSLDKKKLITRSDVFVANDCIVVQLSWTKTIQTSERVLQIPLYASDSQLFPKLAILHAISLSPGQASDLLFSYLTLSGLVPVTQSQFILFLRNCLKHLGFDQSLFSGHSLRRGGASCAFNKGVPSELIKAHGDWKSDSYMVYLQFSLCDRLSTTRTMLD